MNLQISLLWIAVSFLFAMLVWFNAAKMAQRERRMNEKIDEIKRLVAKPGTTLEDVKKVIEKGISVGASTAVSVGTTVIRADKGSHNDDSP